MPQVGFIRDKNEIKYLILYIAERLIAPVPFEVMQELTMCDPAIEFFDFSECLSYLVQTEHMTCSKDDLYAITAKGVQNGRATAEEIPYSVRLTAEKLTEAQNRKILRARQIKTKIAKRGNGTVGVELRLNDEMGLPMLRLELAVPDEARARSLARRFEAEPEKLYGELVKLLFPDKEKE